MKKAVRLLSLLTVICMIFSSCAQTVKETANAIADSTAEKNVISNAVSNTGIEKEVNAEALSASNKNEAVPERVLTTRAWSL